MKDIVTRRNGKQYELEWVGSRDFSVLDNVTQVYGFIFDENGMLVIVNPNTSWRIPGGGPEKEDDSFEDTLMREAEEEADVRIKDIRALGYLKVVPLDSKEKIYYWLRYTARVGEVMNQTIDIAIGDVNERKFIYPEDFSKYADWGDLGLMILDEAVKQVGLK